MWSNRPVAASRYLQFSATHPVHTANILIAGEIQQWSWIDSGSGDKTVLLLPGFMGEAHTSFLYILALEENFRVLSFAYPSIVGTVDTLCDGVVALLDHIQVSRVNVVGGSYSGYLAQVLVRRHPERVNRLILTHTGLPADKHAYTAAACLFFSRLLPFPLSRWIMQLSRKIFIPRSSPSSAFWRNHFSDIISRQTRESMQNRFRMMLDFHRNYDFQNKNLSNWSGSILILEMVRDSFTTSAEQAAMRSLYPSAEVVTFPDAQHTDSICRPEDQISVIKDYFLRSG